MGDLNGLIIQAEACERTVVVQLVNLTDGLVHLKDGRTWPIIAWLDDDYEEMGAQAGAYAFCAGVADEGFIVEHLADYQASRPQ